ncbi:MAG: hypothetical protein K5656_06855 [Lachnospiraceae bacterium]|nr:hypothetical protein [Lachnospiraceae bacterium]
MKEFDESSNVVAELYDSASVEYNKDGIATGREDYNLSKDNDNPIYNKLVQNYSNAKTYMKKMDNFFKLTNSVAIKRQAKKATNAQLMDLNKANADMIDMILNSNTDTYEELIKYLGYIKAEYGLKHQKEKEWLYSLFPIDEKDRNLKVNYLSFAGTKNGLLFKNINDFQDMFVDTLNSNQYKLNLTISRNDLSLDMTMSDFADACGLVNYDKKDFLKKFKANANDSVKSIFTKVAKRELYRKNYYNNILPGVDNEHERYIFNNPEVYDIKNYEAIEISDKDILNRAAKEFNKQYINNLVNVGIDRYIDSRKLEARFAGIAKRSVNEVKLDYKASPIAAWIEESGEVTHNKLSEITARALASDEQKNANKSVSYEQYIRLHTGFEGSRAKYEVMEENLAKAIAADILKKAGREFSLDAIHTAAESVKIMPEFSRITSDHMTLRQMVMDAESVEKCRTDLIIKTYGVEPGKIKEYVWAMKSLYDFMEPRVGQSKEYQGLRTAIKNIADLRLDVMGREMPADISERIASLNTVLLGAVEVYMKGKKKIRKTEEGNYRFNNALDAMGLLSKFVPDTKPQIKVTVDRINEVREAEKGDYEYVDISNYNEARAISANDYRRREAGVELKSHPSPVSL